MALKISLRQNNYKFDKTQGKISAFLKNINQTLNYIFNHINGNQFKCVLFEA